MNEAILKGVTCVLCGAELRISLACNECGDGVEESARTPREWETKALQAAAIIHILMNKRPWDKDIIDAGEKFTKENLP